MSSSSEKPVMVVAMDEHEHSSYALEWTLEHFFSPLGSDALFDLVIVFAKPSPPVPFSMAESGVLASDKFSAAEIQPIPCQITEKAKQICTNKLVDKVVVEAIEGDPRNVVCDAVERHHASLLVLGSRGFGAIKRAVLGSVSDYCVHHANCSVMIVKKTKSKN